MNHRKRKRIRAAGIVLALAMIVSGCFGSPIQARAASDKTEVSVTGRYGQTEARAMLSMINEFRIGDDAWYWNSDDTTKTTLSSLGTLTYDYALEKVAMLRAMEIALSFSHTRPNGTDCFTAYSSEYRSKGENIAAGHTTAKQAFESWREDDETYSGQGHRRNMLSSSFTAVGIAHVYYNGTHYWVQEFGSPVSSAQATEANDSPTTVTIEVKQGNIVSSGISVSSGGISLTYGQTANLPTAKAWIRLTDAWPSRACPIVSAPVWSGTSDYYELGETTITGTAVGTDTVTVTAAGMTESVTVTVAAASISTGTAEIESESYTYTGEAIEPAVTSVTVADSTLTKGTDYEVTYSANVNAGTAYVTVTGIGNYTGSIRKAFTINPVETEPEEEDAGKEDAGNEDPGADNPGSGDNENEDAGKEDAGNEDPGADNPGSGDNENEDAGKEDSGADNPGNGDNENEGAGKEDAGNEDPGADNLGNGDNLIDFPEPKEEDAGKEDAGKEDAGSEDPGADNPGSGDNENEDAGSEDPGADNPESGDNGNEGAGKEDAGSEDPGADNPGNGDNENEDAGKEDIQPGGTENETGNDAGTVTPPASGSSVTDTTASSLDITITAASKKIAAGKKVKLKVTSSAGSVKASDLVWSSSSTKYATVTKSGVVTTKKAGAGKTVTITATTATGKSVAVKIKIMKGVVKKITAKAAKKSVKAGSATTIKTTVKATAGANKALTFTSSNNKYATVTSKGKVTTYKAGKGKTVTITVAATDGSKKKAVVKIKIK